VEAHQHYNGIFSLFNFTHALAVSSKCSVILCTVLHIYVILNDIPSVHGHTRLGSRKVCVVWPNFRRKIEMDMLSQRNVKICVKICKCWIV